MIRFTKALAVATALLVVPTIASALGISVVNVSGAGAGGTLLPGETVTFDLRMDVHTGAPLHAVEVTVDGYDLPDASGLNRQFGLALAGGQVVSEAFLLDIPSIGPTGGIANQQNTTGAPIEQFSVNNINPQAHTTLLFGAISTGGINAPNGGIADGAGDTGLGGNLVHGVPGDIHFQVTFQNVADFVQGVDTTFNFNISGLDSVGNPIAGSGDSFAIHVVPEPGTALLMGLGLAGLAVRRR